LKLLSENNAVINSRFNIEWRRTQNKMAVQTLPDGRVVVYYNDPITKKRRKEYFGHFGRGSEAEARANARHQELSLRRGRPPRKRYGPTFKELADLYYYAMPSNSHPNTSTIMSSAVAGTVLRIIPSPGK
jgi:hypothetical protein